MSEYKTGLQALQESDGYSASAGGRSGIGKCRFAGVFVQSLAPPYPSIADELKKDVAILTSSLKLRERYIDDIRKARDRLERKLNISDMRIEALERDIKRYREFFERTREKEKNSDQKTYRF